MSFVYWHINPKVCTKAETLMYDFAVEFGNDWKFLFYHSNTIMYEIIQFNIFQSIFFVQFNFLLLFTPVFATPASTAIVSGLSCFFFVGGILSLVFFRFNHFSHFLILYWIPYKLYFPTLINVQVDSLINQMMKNWSWGFYFCYRYINISFTKMDL